MGGEYRPFNAFGGFDFTAPALDEEEEERRRREGMFTPAPGGEEVGAMLAPEAPPVEGVGGVEDFGVIQAPEIRGMGPSPTADVGKQYQDWMSRMPTREETEPSTGRKIAGGIAGFLAGLGGGAGMAERTTSGILEGPRRRAMSDWQDEGAALKDVGTYTTTAAETERKGTADVMRLEGINRRVTAARESIEQRKTAEDQRHSDREAAQRTDQEVADDNRRHDKEMESIAQEGNRIDEIFGAAATSRAESAAITAERGPAPSKPSKLGSYTDLDNAIRDLRIKYMSEHQEIMGRYYDENGDVMVQTESLDTAERNEFNAIEDRIEREAKRVLGSLWDDVDEFPTRRQEMP